MNTYLIEYQLTEDHANTITGSCSLVAESDLQAADLFHRCYEGEQRIITKMTRSFVDGERVDEDVLCYPVELGGGPVDLSYRPDGLAADVAEGKSIMEELGNVPGELR